MLGPDETCLIGEWVARDGRVVADDTCHRVETLVSEQLVQLAQTADGWSKCQIPCDNIQQRVWRLSTARDAMKQLYQHLST
jgi:hypothetical protein